MMESIKTKFTGDAFFWSAIGLILLLPVNIYYMYAIMKKCILGEINNIGDVLISLLLFFIFILVLRFFKDMRYIIIDNNKLKYYSIFRPFGKTLYFDNFTGKIIVKETGGRGNYNSIYLVDKQNRTAFKITGLHYKKFGKIIRAIPLKAIDFNPTIGQYFKLAFFERITVENKENKNQGNTKLNNILVAMQIITVIGLALFFIGTIIKMAIKLG